jgi:hypothetical protein
MSKLILHTRSFHPLENFGLGGLGYEGDNRNFSADPGVTARVKNAIEINLGLAKVKELFTMSNTSQNALVGMRQDYTDAELQPTASVSPQIDPYRKDGDQHVQVFLSYRGQNFAMPLVDKEVDIPEVNIPFYGKAGGGKLRGKDVWKGVVPDLDVTNSVDLHIDRASKKITFACRMVGDGFPNAESFLIDDSKQPLFLVTHRRVGSATGQLGGNRRIAMASASAKLDFPADKFGSALDAYWAQDYASHVGGPIDLFQENGPKPSSRSGWNSMHGGRDAKGGKVRRWWLDNDVVWVKGRRGSSMP